MNRSPLEQQRLQYQPHLPLLFEEMTSVTFFPQKNREVKKENFPFSSSLTEGLLVKGEKKQSFALKIGLFLSGGPAPGGHNVISGIFDAAKNFHIESKIYGFLQGAQGLLKKQFIEIDASIVNNYRNLGGFDMLGSSRKKIENATDFSLALKVVSELQLDGIVVVGGDDSNTNAAFLAEYFLANGSKCSVVGVPKTIDGDLKNTFIETSFGFDTATKVYSELIGNLAKDARSSRKYTHFVKLMGRSASHVTLECFLQTQVNIALIGEEIFEKKSSLSEITKNMANVIQLRSEHGKDYGIILIPEGLFEFVPEMQILIQDLNNYLPCDREELIASLKESSLQLFLSFPKEIQEQLVSDLDPHGNIQLSHIATEKLLVQSVEKELKKRNFSGKFHPVTHFFGYEGRCSTPSNFDADYCYTLGFTACALITEKMTGRIAFVQNLHRSSEHWKVGGAPILNFMDYEMRKNKRSFVVKKALVDLAKPAFQKYLSLRDQCAIEDCYCYPGPIQLTDSSIINERTITLALDSLEAHSIGKFD